MVKDWATETRAKLLGMSDRDLCDGLQAMANDFRAMAPLIARTNTKAGQAMELRSFVVEEAVQRIKGMRFREEGE